MNIIKYIPFVLSIITLLSCNNDKKNSELAVSDSSADHSSALAEKAVSPSLSRHRFTDSVLEARIIDTLIKISFVKKTNHYLDSLTGHRHGISFIVDSVGANEISVMAGYDGPERFETYYNFAVYPKTFDIMIEYPDTGELVPIEQYIKLKKD